MLKFANIFAKIAIPIVSMIGIVNFTPAIATAPAPPELVHAKLKGKTVHILYVLRSNDQVLVRCYPGMQPKIAISTRSDGAKEGNLTCK